MDDIFVGRLMSTDLHTVSPETLVEDAASVMLDGEVSSVMVVDADNQLRGILTTTDFVGIVSTSQPKAETTVERYMTTDVITMTVNDSIGDVADVMIEGGFHHVPVVSDTDGVIGMITTSDLTEYVSQVQTPSPA